MVDRASAVRWPGVRRVQLNGFGCYPCDSLVGSSFSRNGAAGADRMRFENGGAASQSTSASWQAGGPGLAEVARQPLGRGPAVRVREPQRATAWLGASALSLQFFLDDRVPLLQRVRRPGKTASVNKGHLGAIARAGVCEHWQIEGPEAVTQLVPPGCESQVQVTPQPFAIIACAGAFNPGQQGGARRGCRYRSR